jgi:two-component system heavy metal sensor histidine kinase CusS
MKIKGSLTARIAALFAAMAGGMLIVAGIVFDRAVSIHFDELDLHDLSAKFSILETLLASVNSEEALSDLPAQISNVFSGYDSIAICIELPALESQPAICDSRIDQMRDSFVAAGSNHPIKWKDLSGKAFIGQGMSMDVPVSYSVQANVFIALDISHHQHFLESMRLYLGIGILLATVFAAILGWFAAKKGLEPMRRVASAASVLSAKSLGQRLSLEDAPSEMQELVRAFNGMLERLESSFDRLNDFSADIAHELRSPVSNLMTATQVALSRSRSADEYSEVLQSNLEEFNRLARMISDMLFLAKADNNILPIRNESVQLEKEVIALFEFYEALADEKGLSLQLNGGGSIQGDQLMLRRALSNLLSNAIRHTDSGNTIDVLIEELPDKGIRLSINNPGKVIPADQIPRIFERFHRVDPSRSRNGDGTGLGLSITRSIVEAHGGEISVTSNLKGTCFTVILPIRE